MFAVVIARRSSEVYCTSGCRSSPAINSPARAGSARAFRAAGAAIGRNPLSIIVPCHRVIGGDGSLTGYAGGLARKSALLRLEGALPAAST
jgi:O-6-methylguanine DNA methyltransferase